MNNKKSMEIFSKAPVSQSVFKNALPAMAAMLMVLIYNLADTFFIGQTHDALQVAAVSLATPVFLIFMAVGTVFGIGGTSVISRALGEGKEDYAKNLRFLHVGLYHGRRSHGSAVFDFYEPYPVTDRGKFRHMGSGQNISDHRCVQRAFRTDFKLLYKRDPGRGEIR